MNPTYEFGGGFPDPVSFPYEGMIEATARMMANEGAAAMTYGDPQGYRGLRELVCEKYKRFESFSTKPDNIIVANGSGHALSLAFSAFLDPGDVVISEAPTFSGSLHTMRRHGPEILDVPVDDEGIVTDAVRERLTTLRAQGRRCKLIYTTIVNFQNPAGPSQSLRRRHALLELANEFDTLILEDDAYGELRFEGETLPPLYALDRNARVIRAGTLFQDPGRRRAAGLAVRPQGDDPGLPGISVPQGGGVNPFMSRVATYYLRDHLTEHVKRLIDIYRAKRDGMLRGLDETLAGTDAVDQPPRGRLLPSGFACPSGTDPKRLQELAVEARAQYTPGTAFFPQGGGHEYIRLAFSYESAEKCYGSSRAIGRAILAAKARSDRDGRRARRPGRRNLG